MKRETPDLDHFMDWVRENLEFSDGASHWAAGLRLHWTEHALSKGARVGSPRAISYELKKLGCPVVRPQSWRRSKHHQGVRLVLPRIVMPPNPRRSEEERRWLETCANIDQWKRYNQPGGAG
jgi:hypothetical protein